MDFAIFKGETSIKDLVSRLFGLQEKGSQASEAQAADALAEALLKANPHLQDIGKVPHGSIVTIPPTAPPVVPSELVAAPASRRAVAAEQAQSLLNSLKLRLADIDSRAAESANALLAAAQSQQAQQAADKNPELKEQLASLVESAQTTLKEIPVTKASRDAATAAVQSRLASFVQKSGQPGVAIRTGH